MDTDTMGLALIVGGAAFICCGLIFMLRVRHRRSTAQKDVEEIERALMRMLGKRGDPRAHDGLPVE
jgi:hypothetical protein